MSETALAILSLVVLAVVVAIGFIKKVNLGFLALGAAFILGTIGGLKAKAITAGRPYIIKWTGGDNLTEPLFEGVTISKGGPQPVTFSGGSFVGNYDEVKVAQGDAFRYIILAGGNSLGYSAVGSTLHNFRAHFEIDDPTEVKACQLSFGEAGTTGIIPIKSESAAQGIYTLDGLRLESIPTRKGIYIKDGKKVIVND